MADSPCRSNITPPTDARTLSGSRRGRNYPNGGGTGGQRGCEVAFIGVDGIQLGADDIGNGSKTGHATGELQRLPACPVITG